MGNAAFHMLRAFGFGQTFMRRIEIPYKDLEAAVQTQLILFYTW